MNSRGGRLRKKPRPFSPPKCLWVFMGKLKKVAIFVDWESIRLGIFEEAETKLTKKINYNQTDILIKFIKSFLDEQREEIYRIFFYLADPFGDILRGVDYSKTPTYRHATSLMDRLAVTEFIALRKGSLVVRGFDKNNNPIFIQKKVDMLLGLDIAHVSYNKLVERVLILSADTDIVPAMKTARINGLQVILGICPDVQTDIHRELKEHSDIIREIPFQKIFP